MSKTSRFEDEMLDLRNAVRKQRAEIAQLTRELSERTTAARTCYACMFVCEATRDRLGQHFAAKWPWLQGKKGGGE